MTTPENLTSYQAQPTDHTHRIPAAPAGPPPGYSNPTSPAAVDGFTGRAKVAFAGAAAVFIGAFLPFITQTVDGQSTDGVYIKPGALHTSAVFGVLLALIAAFTYRARTRRTASAVLAAVAAIGTAGYVIFTIIGIVGVTETDLFDTKVTWAPSAGIIITIAGTITATLAAITELRSGRHPVQPPR